MTAAVTLNRRALAQAVKEEQRRIRTAAVDDLRARIRSIRERRKSLSQRVRAQCKTARARVREQAKARRAAVLDALHREIREMKQAERNRCALRRTRVRHESTGAAARARAELRDAEREHAALRRIESHRARRLKDVRKAERNRSESDDEVRSNIGPDLVPVFDVVKAKVRARPGMSRAEAFLHWAEENPDEIWALREDLAERKLRALIREEQRAARELRKCGGRCRHAPRGSLAEVPF